MAVSAQKCSDLRTWNELAVRTFGDIEVCARPHDFIGRLAVRDWPGLRIADVTSTPAHVRGGAQGRPGWFLLYNWDGACSVQQAGRQVVLESGELSLIRADEAYDLRFEQPNRMCVVSLPQLDTPLGLQERVAARHTRDESQVIGTLLRQLESLAAAELEPGSLRRALTALVALARPSVERGQPTPARTRERQLLTRLELLVSRRLAEPDLDAAALGRELGIGARYVQAIFARQGTTVGAYILEQRLHAAARLLRQPGAETSVTNVAMQTGFGDLAHFCRSFRSRFGCTATDWRAGR